LAEIAMLQTNNTNLKKLFLNRPRNPATLNGPNSIPQRHAKQRPNSNFFTAWHTNVNMPHHATWFDHPLFLRTAQSHNQIQIQSAQTVEHQQQLTKIMDMSKLMFGSHTSH